MEKRSIAQLLIIFLAVVLILSLAISIRGPTTVTANHQAIVERNASRIITFDLQYGQTVSCSFTYYNVTATNGAWFAVYRPDDDPLVTPSLSITMGDNTGAFSFTAPSGGLYYLGIHNNKGWTEYIDYTYTIGPSLVLGLDPLLLIVLVVAAAAVLSTINVYVNWVKPRKRSKIGMKNS